MFALISSPSLLVLLIFCVLALITIFQLYSSPLPEDYIIALNSKWKTLEEIREEMQHRLKTFLSKSDVSEAMAILVDEGQADYRKFPEDDNRHVEKVHLFKLHDGPEEDDRSFIPNFLPTRRRHATNGV